MADFKIGDTVKLKSGGPKMTITSDSAPPPPPGGTVRKMWKCQWFTDKHEVKHADFPPESLMPWTEKDEML
jgi:uncharacterized protein YodC (DUF2158 family)